MKPKYLFFFIAAIHFIFLNSCVFNWKGSVTGNGNVVSDIRTVNNFNELKISGGLDVIINFGNDPGIEVLADENLQEIIRTDVNGKTLVIKPEKSIIRAASKKIYLNVPSLNSVDISAAANVEGQNKLRTEKLSINVSSAGKLYLEVSAEKMDIDISSSGNAEIKGQTAYMNVNISSAGDLDAKELMVEKADVNASSAGSASVYVTEKLNANASSAGKITYYKEPEKINIKTSSGGSVRKK